MVLDFEATCQDKSIGKCLPQEIIEFPSVAIAADGTVVGDIQLYIRLNFNPVLTPFCKELTGAFNPNP